ncbi:hypothetical protein TNCV_3609021 [Trichonephila clavipes]|nr:hypothetical protein TNCV_3609021 [Trichonephila clavipes]
MKRTSDPHWVFQFLQAPAYVPRSRVFQDATFCEIEKVSSDHQQSQGCAFTICLQILVARDKIRHVQNY